METTKWIRWLGVIASGVYLAILAFFGGAVMGYRPNTVEILVYLVIAILPSFMTIFLTALGRFWWSFGVGLWLVFLSLVFLIHGHAQPASVILFIAALTVCMTPFLDRAFQTKNINVTEDDQQVNPPNKR